MISRSNSRQEGGGGGFSRSQHTLILNSYRGGGGGGAQLAFKTTCSHNHYLFCGENLTRQDFDLDDGAGGKWRDQLYAKYQHKLKACISLSIAKF